MKHKRLKMGLLGLALVSSLAGAPMAMAWGPERPTYTNEDPADHAVFNSITDNPVFGDERDFVRIVEVRTDGAEEKKVYNNDQTLEAGKRYEVIMLYHNNASSTLNDKAHDYVGMAYNSKIIANFPHELKAGKKDQVSGTIKSENTSPDSVWDEAYITAKEDMTLHYVTGSAKIHNDWDSNGSVMSVKMFDPEGDYLGVNELDGVVLGCYEFSGYVTYQFETKAMDSEEPVTPAPKPGDPETPKELPTTGPVEIALAVVIVIALIAGIVYWRKSSEAVKKATKSARGRKK